MPVRRPVGGNNPGKRRLIPWILSKLASENYECLKWHDESNLIFRIAYPHKTAKHWAEESTRFLRDWAIYKGKLKVGMKIDYNKLKSNFRCALNSKRELRQIEELRNKKYRYWQILRIPTQNTQDPGVTEKVKAKASCTNEVKKRKRGRPRLHKVETPPMKVEIPEISEPYVEQSSCSPLPCFDTFGQLSLQQAESPISSTSFETFQSFEDVSSNLVGEDAGMIYASTIAAPTPNEREFVPVPHKEAVPTCEDNTALGNDDLELLQWLFRSSSTDDIIHSVVLDGMDCNSLYTNVNSASMTNCFSDNSINNNNYGQNSTTSDCSNSGYTSNCSDSGYISNCGDSGYISNCSDSGYTRNRSDSGYTRNRSDSGYTSNCRESDYITNCSNSSYTSKDGVNSFNGHYTFPKVLNSINYCSNNFEYYCQ